MLGDAQGDRLYRPSADRSPSSLRRVGRGRYGRRRTGACALRPAPPIEQAAQIANLAAGIAVGKAARPPSRRPSCDAPSTPRPFSPTMTKVVDLETAAGMVRAWRFGAPARDPDKWLFRSSCTPGMSASCKRRRRWATSSSSPSIPTSSIKRLKGPGRPVQNEAARAVVMASIAPVDLVVIFPGGHAGQGHRSNTSGCAGEGRRLHDRARDRR